MRSPLFVVILASVALVANAQQQPQLVRDIANQPANYYGIDDYYFERFPFPRISLGDYACIPVPTPEGISTWWITDGTPAGTHQIPDSQVKNTALEGVAGPDDNFFYFTNTKLMKYAPGAEEPEVLAEFDENARKQFMGTGDNLMFTIYYPEDHSEFWRSDGTVEGTAKFKDLNGNYWVRQYASGTTRSYFVTFFVSYESNDNGNILWMSDGTDQGTKMVLPKFVADYGGAYEEFFTEGDLLYFLHKPTNLSWSLWRSDGTTDGTYSFGSGVNDYQTTVPGSLEKLGSKFLAGLSLSDLDQAGLYVCCDQFGSNEKISRIVPRWATIFNNEYYFVGTNCSPVCQTVLAKTDGTSEGTEILADLGNGYFGANPDWQPLGDKLLIPLANDRQFLVGTSLQLGAWFGQLQQADILRDLTGVFADAWLQYMIPVGDRQIFLGEDPEHGYEWWTTDGTTAGTELLLDTWPGTEDASTKWVNEQGGHITVLDNKLMFGAKGKPGGYGVWMSDGTEDGTKQLSDFVVGHPRWFGTLNGSAYYQWIDLAYPENVRGIISADPTAQTSATVWNDQWNALRYGPIDHPLVLNDKLMFTWAPNPTFGLEWWSTDGTQSGTDVLKDFNPGYGDGLLWDGGVKLGDKYIYKGDDGTHGAELCITDATAEGTLMLKDINEGAESSNPVSFFDIGGVGYFFASNGTLSNQLWSSDGTEGGTHLVTQSLELTNIVNGVSVGDHAFFGNWSSEGTELWKTDGTAGGTMLVKTFDETSGDHHVMKDLTAIDGRVYFVLDDDVHGNELWVSDGTEEGTHIIEMTEGPEGSNPRQLKNIRGKLAFVTDHGLYLESGSNEEMVKLLDVVPFSYETLGNNIYFFYDSEEYGVELFTVTMPGRLAQHLQLTAEVTDKTVGDPDFTLPVVSDVGLMVAFYASPEGRVSITEGSARILAAGRVTITASQAGQGTIDPAEDLVFDFCIRPAKPVITVKEDKKISKILESSAAEGNQWLLNGEVLATANNKTFEAKDDGSYSVIATVDDCHSEGSDPMAVLLDPNPDPDPDPDPDPVTGLADDATFSIFPNPAKDRVAIQGNAGFAELTVLDTKGSTLIFNRFFNSSELDVAGLPKGVYVLKITFGTRLVVKKLVKE